VPSVFRANRYFLGGTGIRLHLDMAPVVEPAPLPSLLGIGPLFAPNAFGSRFILQPLTLPPVDITATGDISTTDAAGVDGIAPIGAGGDVGGSASGGAAGIAPIGATGNIAEPSTANVTTVTIGNDVSGTGNIVEPSTANVTGIAPINANDLDGGFTGKGDFGIDATAAVQGKTPIVAPSTIDEPSTANVSTLIVGNDVSGTGDIIDVSTAHVVPFVPNLKTCILGVLPGPRRIGGKLPGPTIIHGTLPSC
jgi:hypothetical protein